MEGLQNYLPLFGILALLFVFYKNAWVSKQEPGNEKMQTIASNISKGAMAFLKAEYKVLAVFVVAVAVLLAFKGANETETKTMPAINATCLDNGKEAVGVEGESNYKAAIAPSPVENWV